MTSLSDVDLLQRYTIRTPEAERAFALLVERHLGLVYSVALRQVRSPQLAEEVAQSVFVDLARNAARIDRHAPLAAWLHLVSRRTAVDVVRRESRRQARERAAATLADMKPNPAPWTAIEPLLDEAVESLPPADRHAILLRFFENKSLREIGAALGTTDDAAQKRVSRALEQLREFFLRRGVTVTAAGFATDLSAFTIEAVPAALGASITSSASLAATAMGHTLAGAAPAAAATVIRKAAVGLAAAALIGVVAYESTHLFQQRQELAVVQERRTQLDASLSKVHAAQSDTNARLREARERLAGMARLTGGNPEVEQAIEAWLQRLQRLRQLATERTEFNIPELSVITEDEWFAVAREAALDTDEQARKTMRKLHESARNSLARIFSHALTRYADTHDGQLPAEPAQLSAHCERRLPPEIFARYEMLPRNRLDSMPSDQWMLAERLDLARSHDSRLYASRQRLERGGSHRGFRSGVAAGTPGLRRGPRRTTANGSGATGRSLFYSADSRRAEGVSRETGR